MKKTTFLAPLAATLTALLAAPAHAAMLIGDFQMPGLARFTGLQASCECNPIPGVPEPATWAMLMIGIGGVGAMMRVARRQQRALRPV